MNFKNKIILLFSVGLVLRLFLAAISFHQDVRTFSFISGMAFKEGSLNFYDFDQNLAASDPRKNEYRIETLDDLPLQYLITLPFYLVTRPLVNTNFEIKYHTDAESTIGDPNYFLYAMYLKLPFIIFDLLVAFVLMKFFKNPKQKIMVASLWLFFPMTLWASAAIGQIDIIPTFFLILAFYLLSRKKLEFSSLSLGVAIALKSFPILLLPFLLFYLDSWKDRIKSLLLVVIPYILTVMPYLSSPNFRHNALFAPQMDKILYAKLPVSGGESILIVPALLMVLYFIFGKQKRDLTQLGVFFLSALLLILVFTHYHLQWFIWLSPFLVLFYQEVREKYLWPVLGLLVAWVAMLFLFEASLQVQLFSPLFPILKNQVGIAESLGSKLDMYKSLAASLFAGCGIYLIWQFICQPIPKIND